MKKLTALIILDGFGYRKERTGNAIAIQGTQNIHSYMAMYPDTLISASGEDVGLPDGQMGNSEVGHLNIGAGRVVYQELLRITTAVRDGSINTNPAILGAIENCRVNDSSLHLYGLLSDGGVHSHIEHLIALVRLAKAHKLKKVYIHCFMDGRDTPPKSGARFLARLEASLSSIDCGKVASVSGRYYAMDRDNHYDRIEKAYAAMVYGEGNKYKSADEAIHASYDAGLTDEFMLPSVITDASGEPLATIKDNDSIIFFNFRPDRAREITRSFIDRDFDKFERRNGFINTHYVCFTQYDATFDGRVDVAFRSETPKNTLAEHLSRLGKSQFHIAETEKYAHVTFFFNGGVETPYPGEKRELIPSPAVKTYDLKPEMSAYEVAEKTCEIIDSGRFDFMVLNFANPDMVGHTGNLEAAIKAVEAVDICTKKVVDRILANGGECLITADHGNCERMISENGAPFTAHTTNPVPLICVSNDIRHRRFNEGGRLCDIAPTLLTMMGLPIPKEMTGRNLLISN
ncbi:MAG: 2,3-bisphosphoglycerate-independent phosphoglycerate mutase [Eubacteriales bacterium]|nr:2,3-bisphosphoglycerate-independent phosphoglycerate mutase [Eubacteriales bacterium]